MSNEKPVISESLIGIAETLIVGGIVFSHVDDAPAEQRTKTEYPYTVEELESYVDSVELRRLATAWVTSAVAVNWEASWGADNRTPDELWGRLMYTLNNGCIAIGRKLRHNMTVDEIIAEFN